MKRKWLGLALAAAMAFAGAATGTEYTDNSLNYESGWENGSNGGEGFLPWKISANSGSGYAGGGIWETEKAEVSGDVVDSNGKAFGIVGKGDGSSFTATRNFRASLDVGDSFEFDMAVNWDCGGNTDSKKGIALLLDGKDAIVINNDAYPGPISVNGFTDDPALQNYGTGTMHWTILAKDETTVTVTGTARDGVSDPYRTDITLASSALTGFRLQSALQQDWEEGETPEERQAKADKRQSYFNNFKLTIARELPPIQNLTLAGALDTTWAVTAAGEQTLEFVVGRDTTDGEVAVSIKSSSDFVKFASETVTFADGEASKTVQATAQLTGNGNYAAITVDAAGYTSPDAYEVKGPSYTCSAWDEGVTEPWIVDLYGTRSFSVDNPQAAWFPGNDALVTVASSDEDVVTVDDLGAWNTDEKDGHTYASTTVTAVGGGKDVPVEVFYDGVKMCEYGFTVLEGGATLSGPTSIRAGVETTYTLDVTLPSGMTDSVGLQAEGESKVVIDPETAQDIDASTSLTFTVTALNAGSFTLKFYDTEYLPCNELVVTVTEAPDPGAYVAYDDASLYTDGFDTTSHGEGERGFDAWSVYQAEAEYGDAFVSDSVPEALSGILEGGQVLGVYANGSWDNNNYKLYRGFGGDIEAGQEFAIDFACQATGGSRFVQVVRMWDGTGYPRFEVYTSDGFVGVNLEGFEGGDIGWPSADRVVHVSVLRSADGSTYTLSLASGSDTWSKDVPASTENWGDGLQGFIVGAWNSGGDLYFNRMSIEQVEEPVPPTPPAAYLEWTAGVWNPDEVGVAYTFGLKSSQDGVIGLVDLEASEGLVLSDDQIDLTAGEATFTATLDGEALVPGTKYTITAKAQLEGVADATYELTATEPSCSIAPQFATFDYVPGGTVEFEITGTPSRIGVTVDLDSDNPNILAPPDPATAVVGGKFTYTMAGVEEGETYIHATYKEGEMTYEWGYAGITINGKASGDEPVVDGTTVAEVKFSNGFSAKATGELEAEFSNVKAQRMEWNGSRDSGFEPVGEELVNQATWPEMKFDLDDPNAVLRFIFVK